MECAQMPSDIQFIAGWAPGGGNYVLPSDVGLELPKSTDSMILQVHYHNVDHYTDANDASGVAFCTGAPRTHLAGIYTLGSLNIQIPPEAVNFDVTGHCGSGLTAYLPEPVTAVAAFPHMHQLGTKFSTMIHRGSDTGTTATLIDVEHFRFDSQQMYALDPPVVVNPKDGLVTTCTYSNPTENTVRLGERTEDEMCFNFVLIYPIELFTGSRSCLF
jgi:hypothetical protein